MLQLLLLRYMFLLQLLSLLLMLLLQLLRLGCISLLLRDLLMFLVLVRLESLPFLFLLRVELFLLFLVFLVRLRIPGIWRGRALDRRKILGVYYSGRVGIIFLRTARLLVTPRFCPGAVGWRMVRRSRFLGRYHRVPAELPRFFGGRDWRVGLVHRSPQLWIRARSLHMLCLGRYWRHVSLSRRCLFLRGWTRLNPSVPTVVADAVYRRVVHHRRVVNIVDVGNIHIGHGSVIEKCPLSQRPPAKPTPK